MKAIIDVCSMFGNMKCSWDFRKSVTEDFWRIQAPIAWENAVASGDVVPNPGSWAAVARALRSGGRVPGCHSFAPDTPVLMADGTTRAIKDVRVGDDVIGTDPATGKTASEPVTALHVNQDTDLTDVWVTHIDPHNAPPGPDVHTAGLPQGWSGPPATYLLHTTANHPF
jgi:hypothetical protein